MDNLKTKNIITKNTFGWGIVFIITMASLSFMIWGPDIHSEVADAPTLYSNIASLLFLFFVSGALFLPVKNSSKINHVIVSIGSLILVGKYIYSLIGMFNNEQNLSILIPVLIGLILVSIILYKIKLIVNIMKK
jgi:hypothetical protein